MNSINPFKGPKPYEEGDQDDFRGRDAEIAELYGLVKNDNLTLLFSRSGTGKSSLINAGLIPALKKEMEFFPIYLHLNEFLVSKIDAVSLVDFVIKTCLDKLRKQDMQDLKFSYSRYQDKIISLFEFIELLTIVQVEVQPDGTVTEFPVKPVLLFDQLEEIFTQSFKPDDLDFLYSEIRCLIENEIPEYLKDAFIHDAENSKIARIKKNMKSKQKDFRMLFSFREEYLPEFESLRTKIPPIKFTNSRFRLEPFTVATAMNVITETAPEFPVETAKTISENLSAKIMGFDEKRVDPFLLSLICQVIYPEVRERGGAPVGIQKMVNDAIESYLQKVYNNIGSETKKFIEKRLVTPEGTKNSVNYNEIEKSSSLETDVKKLIEDRDYRLLTKGQFLDAEHVSLLHDRLLPPLFRRRRERAELDRWKGVFLTAGVASLVIVGVYLFLDSKKQAKEQIIRAFAFNNYGKRMTDDTKALQTQIHGYWLDSNFLIGEEINEKFQENAFYETVVSNEPPNFYSAAISRDGSFCISGTRSGRLYKWSTDTTHGNHKENKTIDSSSIFCIAIAPDGKEFLTGDNGKRACLYNLTDPEPISIFNDSIGNRGHKSYVSCVSFLGENLVLTGSGDSTIKVWNRAGGFIKTLQEKGQGEITAIAAIPHSKMFLVSSTDQKVRLWDAEHYRVAQTFFDSSGVISALSVSPACNFFVTGSEFGIVCLHSLDTGQLENRSLNSKLWNIRTNNGVISSLAFAEDGNQILTGSIDQKCIILDLTGKEIKKLTGHTDGILSAIFSSPSDQIVTCSTDGTVKKWHIPEQDDKIKDFVDLNNPIIAVSVSPNKELLTGSTTGRLSIWDIGEGKKPKEINTGRRRLGWVDYCKDGSRFLAVFDKRVIIWNNSGLPIDSIGQQSDIISAKFSNDGQFILMVGADSAATIWKKSANERYALLKPLKSNGQLLSAAFSPDGRYVLTGSSDSSATLWPIEGNKTIKLQTSNSAVGAVCFSPVGDIMATGSADKIVRIYQRDGSLVTILGGGEESITSLSISNDGKKILAGCNDGKVLLWNMANGATTTTTKNRPNPDKIFHMGSLQLSQRNDPIRSVDFGPDGNTVIVSSGSVVSLYKAAVVSPNEYLKKYPIDKLKESEIDSINGIADKQLLRVGN